MEAGGLGLRRGEEGWQRRQRRGEEGWQLATAATGSRPGAHGQKLGGDGGDRLVRARYVVVLPTAGEPDRWFASGT